MYKHHSWRTPCGHEFRVVLGRTTYSVALHDPRGKRIEWSGRNWGPSLTDALMMACYVGDRTHADAAIHYLFTRIDPDFEGNRRWVRDLWDTATYVGRPESQYVDLSRPFHAIADFFRRDDWKLRRVANGITSLAKASAA
jgi:hypothetical protein